jgi:hypothetical protein
MALDANGNPAPAVPLQFGDGWGAAGSAPYFQNNYGAQGVSGPLGQTQPWSQPPPAGPSAAGTGIGPGFLASPGGSPGAPGGLGGWWNQNGTAITEGIGAFGSLAEMYMGFKAMSLAKKDFKLAKKNTRLNYNANATAFNNAVDSKNMARKTSGGLYEGLSAYGGGQPVPMWDGSQMTGQSVPGDIANYGVQAGAQQPDPRKRIPGA